MTTCPTCTGKKTITATIVEGSKETAFVMPCHSCSGQGTVTETVKRQINRAVESWCRCGNPSGGTRFYDDGQHAECRKHHWRCNDCGKIVQVG